MRRRGQRSAEARRRRGADPGCRARRASSALARRRRLPWRCRGSHRSREPSAEERPDGAAGDRDQAEDEARAPGVEAVAHVQVLGRPEREAADREGVGAVAEDRRAIERDAQRAWPRRPSSSAASRRRFDAPSRRGGLGEEEAEERRERDPGPAATKKAARQPCALHDRAADDVAERRADRGRRVEDRQPRPLRARGGHVVDERRREGRVAGLADADEGARSDERRRRPAPARRPPWPRSTRAIPEAMSARRPRRPAARSPRRRKLGSSRSSR